ncbi:bifunctional 2-polyprenyl-6-hydroxyphenol methylase/3-demethylubiquinol 3-O-methyltransferase UbiG [Ancylobacter sp. FA202]|uniref:class I SAM-dependent methyltransferase n=1 Tax=Ancylobacter sp. FA202 TaxID=1111106 RepID=UPI001FD9B26D|nr:methyltransferase domain-containing protein [Ancylobacter sp. FA202]
MIEGGAAYLDKLSRSNSSESQTQDEYYDYHKKRFDCVISFCLKYCPNPECNVLDIGRSVLSGMLLQKYKNVTTMGFALDAGGGSVGDPRLAGIRGHIVYDLNNAQSLEEIPCDEKFDLVVFAEVVEHLYTAPELTMFALRSVMNPGGIMILQTPNAASLNRRIKSFFGLSPTERIRIDNTNPGHFREYTKNELIEIARIVGFEVCAHHYLEYFGVAGAARRSIKRALFSAIVGVIPPFRRGQTLILRRPA